MYSIKAYLTRKLNFFKGMHVCNVPSNRKLQTALRLHRFVKLLLLIYTRKSTRPIPWSRAQLHENNALQFKKLFSKRLAQSIFTKAPSELI